MDTPSSTQANIEKLQQLAGVNPVVKVTVNGQLHEIEIKQIKTGKIPKLLKACGSLIYALNSGKGVGFDVQSLMLNYSDECLDTLAVLIERDRSFVDDLELMDAVELLTSCLEVNLDFFVRHVLPSVSGAMQKGLELLARRKEAVALLAGQTPLSTSSQPGTTNETSGSTDTASSGSTSKPQ